jgi:hypothetical protein
MSHLERGITYAVAGLTSTGKTRLVEHTTRNLRDRGYDAVSFSVGDMFRHLIRHVQPPYDSSDALIASVHATLKQTSVVMDAGGRVRLVYNGELVRQTYENGNLSARISTNGQLIYHVDEYIRTNITGPFAHHDFVGLDGRERRDAQILFRTTAPRKVRIDVRRVDDPVACAALSDETIRQDISVRDHLEFPLLRGLFGEDVNVVTIDRQQANGESDRHLSEAMSGILVDFSRGKMETNFGTIPIGRLASDVS